MNRESLLISIGVAFILSACGAPQASVPVAPAAPARIEVTIYPQTTKPKPMDSGIIRISAPAATATPQTLPTIEATAVPDATEAPLPTAAPTEPMVTPIVIVLPATDGTVEGVRNEMLALHNNARAAQGMPPFTMNAALQQAAQQHAEWLAQKPLQTLWSLGSMAHFGEDNTSYVDRISAAGYATSANRVNENYGTFGSAQEAFDWWMTDPAGAATHRPQILSLFYTEIGIGVVKHPSGMSYVFIINFGAR